MRGLGLIGLLLALLVVGLVAKKQMTSAVVPTLPSVPGVAAPPAGEPAGNVHAQSQRLQQQVKDAVEAASKPRVVPDDN